jgi:F-type H+-transporting ATPase subunit delta
MNHSKIAVRYSKALFMLAMEQNLIEPVRGDIALVFKTCSDIPEFMLFLQSPIVKPSEKQKMMQLLFTGKVNAMTLNFLNLITLNKREHHIPDIARNFLDLYRKEKGIKTVVLTCAAKIDEASRKQLVELIRSTYKKEVEMTEITDERLIGGFILRLDDQQYDASVASRLSKLKQEMLNPAFKKN